MIYSYRNGQTDFPYQEGYFWRANRAGEFSIVKIECGWEDSPEWTVTLFGGSWHIVEYYTDIDGWRWWGPIPKPPEEPAAT